MSVSQPTSSSPSGMRRQISAPALRKLKKEEKKEGDSKIAPGIRRARSSQHLGEPIGLLVEDENVSAKVEKLVLENALQGKFDIARHFNEAIQKLQSRYYRYLVTDHNLTSGDAALKENKTVYESERDRLFPHGLPGGLAEGYVLGRFANELPLDRRPEHRVLISKPTGITEEELRKATLEQGMEFRPKPITPQDFIELQNQWRQAHVSPPPPGETLTLTSTAPPGEHTTGSSATSSTVSAFATATPPVLSRVGASASDDSDQHDEGSAIEAAVNPFHSLSLSAPTGSDAGGDAGEPDKGKTSEGEKPSGIDVTKEGVKDDPTKA